jgi:hypothetical protein
MRALPICPKKSASPPFAKAGGFLQWPAKRNPHIIARFDMPYMIKSAAIARKNLACPRQEALSKSLARYFSIQNFL